MYQSLMNQGEVATPGKMSDAEIEQLYQSLMNQGEVATAIRKEEAAKATGINPL